MPKETALKLASPFGGGVARSGEICGAVSGALMALGLARGNDTPEKKEETYHLAQEFLRRFEQKHQALRCRDLTGCELNTPEGHQKAVEKGVFRSLCPLLVSDAVEIVQAKLD